MNLPIVTFPGCAACAVPARKSSGVGASHRSGRRAIPRCFHGPVQSWFECRRTARPFLEVDGRKATVFSEVRERDVAWLWTPDAIVGVLGVTPRRPAIGQFVHVVLPTGATPTVVVGFPVRHGNLARPFELRLSTQFKPGDSGNPVPTSYGQVIAVVRDTSGRCGFVLRHPSCTP